MRVDIDSVCAKRENSGTCKHYYCEEIECCTNIIAVENDNSEEPDIDCCEISFDSHCPVNTCELRYKGDKI
jgi:hypothetical protein